MNDVPVQVIVAAFQGQDAAGAALKLLQDAKRDRLIDIQDAAVIAKDAAGKVKIRDTKDMGAGKGFTIGAITGGVLGLLAGPIGWAALGGGVIGGLAAKLRDGGFPDARLKQVAEGLTPNSSALIAVIDHRWVADLERELAQQGANVIAEALRDDIARQLQAGGEALYTIVDSGDAVYAGRAAFTDAATEVSAIAATPEGVVVSGVRETDDKLVGGAAVVTDQGAAVIAGAATIEGTAPAADTSATPAGDTSAQGPGGTETPPASPTSNPPA